jgi:polyisoprenoid-binding protein YceI
VKVSLAPSIAALACVAVLSARSARAADLFLLDQRYGTIAFSVDHFGSFSSKGAFPRFTGRLAIDRAHPENTTIDVEADATAVTIPWTDGDALLRGPDFFDAAHHRAVHFTSKAIRGIDPKHFQIEGTLEMRGVKRPLTLDATLERQAPDPAKGTEVADFTVTGVLSRADYGMTAQPMIISDRVKIQIAARIKLPAQKQ